MSELHPADQTRIIFEETQNATLDLMLQLSKMHQDSSTDPTPMQMLAVLSKVLHAALAMSPSHADFENMLRIALDFAHDDYAEELANVHQ